MSNHLHVQIDQGIFDNRVNYPHKKDFTTKCKCNCKNCKKTVLDKEAYLKAMNEYRAGEKEALDYFKAEALDEVGMANHPKKDRVFKYAWGQSHSNGLHGVYGTLQNLADIIFGDELS